MARQRRRASLRQSLSSIRKVCNAGDIIVTHSDAVGLDVDRLITDITVLLGGAEATEIAELEEASGLYRGDLLEGLGSISPEFDRWIEAELGALRSKFSATLLRLSDSYEAERRFEEMIAVALKLLSIDPLQEHVHRMLMRAFLSQKRFDARLKQFEFLRETLANELGVEPESPTLELLRDIRAARRRGSDPFQMVLP